MARDGASVGDERVDEYIAELDSVRDKADAAFIKADAASIKAGELEGVIKALEARLSQVEETSYKDRLEKEELKQKLEKCEAEIEKSRKTDELNLIPLHAADEICRKLFMEISDLPEDLLVKILSFLPTRDAVATSILSKQWQFRWMWLPNLEFHCNRGSVREFINKNLPLHKAPLIKSLRLGFHNRPIPADDCKTWVETAVSRGLQEISIQSYRDITEPTVFLLPGSLYTCNTLVTLKLEGDMIFVDVPENPRLPSLKKMHLWSVTYSNGDSLRLLLSCCPILEDLCMKREYDDNGTALVIKIPSLKRLSLYFDESYSSDYGCVICTPSLKYIKVCNGRENCSYSFEDMPEIEEADISVLVDSHLGDIFKSISTVRSLSLRVYNAENEAVYGDGIVFSKLENLKVEIFSDNWSKITFQFLKDSPNLQVLDLIRYNKIFEDYEPIGESLVPECLWKSLKTFNFRGYAANDKEDRDFLSFIMKHACCLESTLISVET